MERTPAAAVLDSLLHGELIGRLQKLQTAASRDRDNAEFNHFLGEVDAALKRFEDRTYGLCEECHAPIEPERLLADPLVRFCLGDLTPKQRQALEDDLELAAQIQQGLLPRAEFENEAWKVDYVYQPAGVVSGDYVDVIRKDGELHFVLGDVSGKGMAASLLMSNLHAMFHSMIPLNIPIVELMDRANRIFCESTLSNQYATLIYGKVDSRGEVELSNAGHLPPIVIKNGVKGELSFAGLPLGMFSDAEFETSKLTLGSGDSLFLFTDGVTETIDADGLEFGTDRLFEALNGGETKKLISNCLDRVAAFRGNAERRDDLTMLTVAVA
jgi:sigma-B regulation protein RsbU (phosphoserine phosphatase)